MRPLMLLLALLVLVYGRPEPPTGYHYPVPAVTFNEVPNSNLGKITLNKGLSGSLATDTLRNIPTVSLGLLNIGLSQSGSNILNVGLPNGHQSNPGLTTGSLGLNSAETIRNFDSSASLTGNSLTGTISIGNLGVNSIASAGNPSGSISGLTNGLSGAALDGELSSAGLGGHLSAFGGLANAGLAAGSLAGANIGSGNVQVQKHIYVHLAPEDPEEVRQIPQIQQIPRQKHYKIIFIKAPSFVAQQQARIIAQQQAQSEEKTIVYVLVRKPAAPADITIPAPAPTEPSKPEVYFIKYKAASNEGEAAIGGLAGAAGVSSIPGISSGISSGFPSSVSLGTSSGASGPIINEASIAQSLASGLSIGGDTSQNIGSFYTAPGLITGSTGVSTKYGPPGS